MHKFCHQSHFWQLVTWCIPNFRHCQMLSWAIFGDKTVTVAIFEPVSEDNVGAKTKHLETSRNLTGSSQDLLTAPPISSPLFTNVSQTRRLQCVFCNTALTFPMEPLKIPGGTLSMLNLAIPWGQGSVYTPGSTRTQQSEGSSQWLTVT